MSHAEGFAEGFEAAEKYLKNLESKNAIYAINLVSELSYKIGQVKGLIEFRRYSKKTAEQVLDEIYSVLKE